MLPLELAYFPSSLGLGDGKWYQVVGGMGVELALIKILMGARTHHSSHCAAPLLETVPALQLVHDTFPSPE